MKPFEVVMPCGDRSAGCFCSLSFPPRAAIAAGGGSIGEGIACFASEEAQRSARPSVAGGNAPLSARPRDALSPRFDSFRIATRRWFRADGTSLYGTGMAGDRVSQRSTVTCRNYDAYGHDSADPHLYQSHPCARCAQDGSAFMPFDTTYRAHRFNRQHRLHRRQPPLQ
jgi:hypothetical protein